MTYRQASGGIGLLGVLGVAFVVLKLVGVINWPWMWVLAPFWLPLAITLLALFIVILVATIFTIKENK